MKYAEPKRLRNKMSPEQRLSRLGCWSRECPQGSCEACIFGEEALIAAKTSPELAEKIKRLVYESILQVVEQEDSK